MMKANASPTEDPGDTPSSSCCTCVVITAAVLLCLLVPVLGCVLVLVMVIVRRKKQSSILLVPGEYKYKGKTMHEDGITNAVYAYAYGEEIETRETAGGVETDEENSAVSNRDTLPGETQSPESEGSYSYAYPNTESKISFRHAVTKPKNASSKSGRENIYMAPASEEQALYAQIVDIRIEELPRNSVKLGEVLGAGNFGTVNQGVLETLSKGKGHEVEVAVKTLKEGSGEEDRVRFLQEAAIMGQFKHPNVVKLHGVVMEDEPVLIVLELLAKGDLRQHLATQKNEFTLSIDKHTLLSYCRQVASGMAYLSNKAFVHRDLAARNILVSEHGLCKIADFGMSRDLMDEDYYVSHGGKIPVKWTAPEAINYRKYSTASDVWSYGILLFEIWSLGHKPYEDFSVHEVIRKVDEGYRLPPPPLTPRAVYELMITTWDPNTATRPSFDDLMEQLSLPDTILLQSTETEAEPAAAGVHARLGDELSFGLNLYIDLQNRYRMY